MAAAWTVRESNPGWGEIFRTCPDRPWGPHSLLYNGYRFFPEGQKRPEREVDPSPLLVPCSWKGRAIPLLPLWAVRPVQSLSARTMVHFSEADSHSAYERISSDMQTENSLPQYATNRHNPEPLCSNSILPLYSLTSFVIVLSHVTFLQLLLHSGIQAKILYASLFSYVHLKFPSISYYRDWYRLTTISVEHKLQILIL